MNFPLLSAQLGTAQLGKAQLGQMMVQTAGPSGHLDANKIGFISIPNFYSWVLKRDLRRPL